METILSRRKGWSLNCPFGESWSYFNYNKNHTGIDLAGPEGTPIYSFIKGTVWGVKYEKSYGHVLLIKDDSSTLLYLLAHLRTIKLEKWDPVERMNVISWCGHTGTGGGDTNNAHLHLEVFDIGDMKQTDVENPSSAIWIETFWKNIEKIH